MREAFGSEHFIQIEPPPPATLREEHATTLAVAR
jgi:hypothetical protein